MLKLKKLEIQGFKSFCDRQELHFNGGGVSAIVGPNGCGKSNISDSISWVLGERSAKSLRGSRMGDVIFSGSRDRKPSGLATVSLTLIDPDAYLAERSARPESNGLNGSAGPTGPLNGRPAEITVTRKLFRSGESDYLMNGKVCRLRDIQELFMGTGLGPEHYAIIEQGRIGQILSSRPIDRRAFIEEAAGVTKFKSKKRLAEFKLESARQNLNRVNDILQEVIRQVNSLKRQASRARRYEELRKQWRENLSRLMASRYAEMNRRISQATAELRQADEQLENLTSGVLQLETALRENRQQEQLHEQNLEQQREELSQLTVEVERCRSRAEQQARTVEETRNRKQSAEAEIVRVDERLRQLDEELTVEQAALREVEGQAEEIRRRLGEKTAELGAVEAAIQEDEQRQESCRQQVLRLMGELSSLRNELAKMEEFLAGNERHIARVEEERNAAEFELSQLQQGCGEFESRIQHRQQELDSLAEQRNQIQREISEHKQQAQARRKEVEELQQELSRLRARRESLEEILSHHAYTTETVKNLFATIQSRPREDFEPLGILADFVEVHTQYEKASEEFLRDELEYVVVKDWNEARQGIQLIQSDLRGSATFLVHPQSQEPAEAPFLGPESGVVGRLADHVRLTNGLSGSASTLLPRLRLCYLVEKEDAAERLAKEHPDLYFVLPDGRWYHGHTLSGGRKASAGPLTLKRELRELRPRLANLEQQLETASQAARQAEQEISQKSERLESLQLELQQAEREVLGLDHEIRQLNDHMQRAERRMSVSQSDLERLRTQARQTLEQAENNRNETAQREQERMDAEGELSKLRVRIQESQALRARLAEEQTGLRTELATLEERRKAAAASLARVDHLSREQQERRERITAQMEQWESEITRLLSDNIELERQIGEHAERREQLQQQVTQEAAALQASRDRVAGMDEELKQKREELEVVRQHRSGIELRLVEVRSDLKHLEEDCRRELSCPMEELGGAPEELDPEQLSEAESIHQELTRKIETLGPVNVLALEEFEESRQRMEFLETQRKDLLDSIRDTQQAISEIDTVSQQRFKEAFEEINKNFREMFAALFGGGVGEMRLIEAEDPAESGVEIVASPPGKRLQNIALLSGGEKSLTALALLMATFRYRPSPFCVLDEVDAALDEPNLVRFRRLVEQMSDQTQFILITHSRTTMEAAQTLYGVTMQEPGVSKLVSVRMSDHEPRPETRGAPVALAAGR